MVITLKFLSNQNPDKMCTAMPKLAILRLDWLEYSVKYLSTN